MVTQVVRIVSGNGDGYGGAVEPNVRGSAYRIGLECFRWVPAVFDRVSPDRVGGDQLSESGDALIMYSSRQPKVLGSAAAERLDLSLLVNSL